MDPISLIVIGILFGTVVLIVILYIGKTLAERKSNSGGTKEVFVKPTKTQKLDNTTDSLEEIAVIIAAIEAFTGGTSFKIRQIINKKNGALVWHQAGVNQNNVSFD